MIRTGRRVVAAAGAATVLVLAGCGDDASPSAGSIPAIAIGDAWARATVTAATTGAVYLDVAAADDDELVGADVAPAVAEAVSLHQTVTSASDGHDGHGDAAMVTMSDLDRLPLPAGEAVSLQPGGTHLMLVELATPLVAGTSFEVTLHFATADDVTVVVEVRTDP